MFQFLALSNPVTLGIAAVATIGFFLYKSNKDNATIVVCHTTFGNKDVFIGDYNMQFDSESMCKR